MKKLIAITILLIISFYSISCSSDKKRDEIIKQHQDFIDNVNSFKYDELTTEIIDFLNNLRNSNSNIYDNKAKWFKVTFLADSDFDNSIRKTITYLKLLPYNEYFKPNLLEGYILSLYKTTYISDQDYIVKKEIFYNNNNYFEKNITKQKDKIDVETYGADIPFDMKKYTICLTSFTSFPEFNEFFLSALNRFDRYKSNIFHKANGYELVSYFTITEEFHSGGRYKSIYRFDQNYNFISSIQTFSLLGAGLLDTTNYIFKIELCDEIKIDVPLEYDKEYIGGLDVL